MAKKKETKKKIKKPLLDGKLEKIIEQLIAGDSYRVIAEKYKVSLGTLFNYLHNSEHSARVIEALNYSASTFDDKAEKVLLEINAESQGVEMQRARELAQHYRWKASKRSPKEYGERIQQDVTIQQEQPLYPDNAADE